MAKTKPETGRPRWVPVVEFVTVIVTLALMVLGCMMVLPNYMMIVGGRPVLLNQETVDLRDARLSVEEYEALREKMGDKEILWSVPIGGQYHESSSEYIILDQLKEEEIPNFRYLPNLKTVDAGECADHGALTALQEAYPGLNVEWMIHLGSQKWSRDMDSLDLREIPVTAQELMDTLGYFADGTQVRLKEFSLTDEEIRTLTETYPELQIFWGVELMGEIYSSGEKKLSFAGQSVDPDVLASVADQFTGVEEMDLTGCGLSLAELVRIQEVYPGAVLLSEMELHGLKFTTLAEELDFSGIQMASFEEIEQAVRVMPNLKKVIMSDCGFSNEQMDELNRRHEDVMFVWTVYFSVYSLRTDALGFCASDLPQYGYVAPRLRNKDLEPLKYCTELTALDLGHMDYDDLSFLKDMHKLEYLILVDARFTDISVIGQMKNLKYLEIFKNEIHDLSPLLECKNLRHLNVGFVRGFDYTPLTQMTWLERLWYPGHTLEDAQRQAIVDALPNTEVYMPRYDPDGSTGGKWREADIYFEMRNLFGMFYQPGGTGMNQNN